MAINCLTPAGLLAWSLLAVSLGSSGVAAAPVSIFYNVPDGLEGCGQSDVSLSFADVDDATEETSLTYSNVGKITLNLQKTYDLEGECAPMVHKVFGRIVLYNDIVLEGPERGFAAVPDLSNKGRFLPPELEADLAYDGYALGDLIAYGTIRREEGQQTSYLAVWEGDGEWRLTQFTVMADGHVSDQQVLLSSSYPLRSAHFLQEYHSPRAMVWMVQEVAPDQVRVFRFSWTYADPPPEQ